VGVSARQCPGTGPHDDEPGAPPLVPRVVRVLFYTAGALLLVLLRASGQVVSRQRLEEALYGFDDALESNALEVHIHHLRRKLGNDLVQTVRRVGYFVPAPPAPHTAGPAA